MKKFKSLPTYIQTLFHLIPIVISLLPIFYISIQAQAIWAILFLLIWVYLPGRFLARLLKNNPKTIFGTLTAFFLGFIGLVLLFYMGRNVYLLRFVPSFFGIFGLGQELFYVKKSSSRKLTSENNKLINKIFAVIENPIWWVLAFAISWSFYLLTTCLSTPISITNTDYFWHMGNIYTLADSPQFQDIRVFGMTFTYHYFADLLWACGKLVLNLNPFLSVTSYPLLIAPILMALSIWELLRTIINTPWKRAICSIIILLWTPLYGLYNDFTYQWATNVNAVGIALPCTIWLILFCIQTLNSKKIQWQNIIIILFGAALVTGLKGPFALCALAAVTGGLLVRLLKKKKMTKTIWFIPLAILLGFFLIWFLLLRTGLNEGYISSWQPAYSVYTAEVLAPLLIAFGNGLFARLILLPLHLIIILGIFSVPFIFACVRFIVQFCKNTLPKNDTGTFYLAGSVASLLVFYMLDLRGRSQFYFLYFSVPFVAAVALLEVKQYWLPKMKQSIKLISCAIVAVFTIFAMAHPMIESPQALYSQSELNASIWLAENVSDSDIVATNRHSAFYMASAFSGKQFYLEGDTYARNSGVTQEMLEPQRELNDSLFQVATQNKTSLANELGIDYLIQFKNNVDTDLLSPLEEWYTLVWREGDVSIYKVE